MSRFVT